VYGQAHSGVTVTAWFIARCFSAWKPLPAEWPSSIAQKTVAPIARSESAAMVPHLKNAASAALS
jgi:hypothetical protein